MLLQEDVVCKEVDPPLNNWCASGHAAPINFRRGGPNSPEEPTRFFSVICKDEFLGVFCEPCLIIANWLQGVRKKDPNFMK